MGVVPNKESQSPYLSKDGGQSISKAVSVPFVISRHQGWFNTKWKSLLSGITPHVSTLCPPTCDQISQAFPLCICILQAIKCGGGNGLGTRLG